MAAAVQLDGRVVATSVCVSVAAETGGMGSRDEKDGAGAGAGAQKRRGRGRARGRWTVLWLEDREMRDIW
jgi:hypothetical protein